MLDRRGDDVSWVRIWFRHMGNVRLRPTSSHHDALIAGEREHLSLLSQPADVNQPVRRACIQVQGPADASPAADFRPSVGLLDSQVIARRKAWALPEIVGRDRTV